MSNFLDIKQEGTVAEYRRRFVMSAAPLEVHTLAPERIGKGHGTSSKDGRKEEAFSKNE